MRKLALIPILSLLAIGSTSAADPGGPREPSGALDLTDAGQTPLTSSALIASNPLAAHVDAREARRKMRIARRRARPKPPKPEPVTVSPHLQAIAACESGGDPTAIGGGGLYRGKYQFSIATWQGVGGTGDPAAASEAEQDLRATILYERSGPGQWPTCGL
jgi:hypothetical protein